MHNAVIEHINRNHLNILAYQTTNNNKHCVIVIYNAKNNNMFYSRGTILNPILLNFMIFLLILVTLHTLNLFKSTIYCK